MIALVVEWLDFSLLHTRNMCRVSYAMVRGCTKCLTGIEGARDLAKDLAKESNKPHTYNSESFRVKNDISH